MIKEACTETIDQCIQAQQLGADRVEFCADLQNDGLTPAHEDISTAFGKLAIPIRVMIRPRAGDFVYNEWEIQKMKADIEFCKNVGVEGVVFGVCTTEGRLDLELISELAQLAFPLKVVIHKAIDHCLDPLIELKRLNTIKNVSAVLTSGKSKTALEGIPVLKSLLKAADSKLQIVACGKITKDNLAHIHNLLGASAYHGRQIVGDLGTINS
ncbi:MAG: copper homeostasis protein CutC [Bacteroidota bacterium]